jgi:hypothetical protein
MPITSARRCAAFLPRAAALLAVVALCACSVDVSGLTPVATVAGTAVSSATAAGPTATQPAAATPGGTPISPPATLAPEAATPVKRPITWADRGLSGKLVFTAGTQGVLQLDLATGDQTILFAPPDAINSWVVAAARSPVADSLVIAYTPPPPAGGVQFGYASLFTLDLATGGEPQPLFNRVITKETFFDPTWSPDGHWLYYVHLTAPLTATASSRFAIERIEFPSGAPEVVVEDAFWPRLSSDGSQLAYVHYDQLNGANTLFVAAANGSQSRQIALPATFQSVDSPMFTPDGATIVFSGINGQGAAALSWLDRLMGVQTAYADGSPADWFSIPAAGGQPQQMTHINDTSMYGAFAPDGKQIAYISGSGVFLMNVDGSGILPLLSVNDLPGSVGTATMNWVP